MMQIVGSLYKDHDMFNVPFVKQDVDILHSWRPMFITVAVLAGLCSLVVAWSAKNLRDEFSWSIYRFIGGNLSMRRRYRSYEVS